MARSDIADVYYLPIGDEEERGVIVAGKLPRYSVTEGMQPGGPILGFLSTAISGQQAVLGLVGARMGLVAGRARARW
jgi:hypothetical protein